MKMKLWRSNYSACQPLPGTGPNSVLTSKITEISGLRHLSQNSTSVVSMYRRNNYAKKSYRSNIVFPTMTWFDSRCNGGMTSDEIGGKKKNRQTARKD